MVIWQEIWISLITCNFTPFYPIEMGFSVEFIDFYEENYYQIYIYFFSEFSFGCQIWTSYMTSQ